MTRVLSYVMQQARIPHDVWIGTLIADGEEIVSPHWWIVTHLGIYVDYRARMWVCDEDWVAHGVFRHGDFPRIVYKGQKGSVTVDRMTFDILTDFGKGIPQSWRPAT